MATVSSRFDLSAGQDLLTALQGVASQNPDVIYFPLYTDDGVALMKAIPQAGFSDPALISSDGLLSPDFLEKAGAGTEGMYLSGPADVQGIHGLHAEIQGPLRRGPDRILSSCRPTTPP